MTAITPAYAHAYQVRCLTRHMSAVPRLKLQLTEAQSQKPASPQRSYHNTRKKQ